MKYFHGSAIEQMDSSSPDVSIILVNWNTCALTLECIESIRKNTTGVSYEIIVVDNASSDDSVVALKSIPGVHLIANSTNEGFARANNLAMKIAKGKAWLLLNTDTIILDDVIKACCDLLWSAPSVGMVGCKMLNANLSLQPSCFKFLKILAPLLGREALVSRIKRWRQRSPYFAWRYSDAEHLHRLSPDWIMGAFMLIKPTAASACGLLDERFFMYAEDMEWCYRFRKNGWHIVYTPDCSIIHLGGSSSSAVPEDTVRRRVAGLNLFFKIHRPWARRLYLAAELLGLLLVSMVASTVYRRRFLAQPHLQQLRSLKIQEIWKVLF
jgi:GT2 family glycosyltransferase